MCDVRVQHHGGGGEVCGVVAGGEPAPAGAVDGRSVACGADAVVGGEDDGIDVVWQGTVTSAMLG